MENEVGKLDSPWSNSKIFLQNSEWVAENVKGFDESVKEMLLLIEHDGDSLYEKPYDHPMRLGLIACIKEISHKHHLLVDHYNKLMEESKNYEKTTLGPQSTHPFLTPEKEKKVGMQNVEGQGDPSEFSLSSGGGISDTTPIEGSESSLLSSDSDSESYNSSTSEKMLVRRISDYEKELMVSKEKLGFAEEEIARLKSQLESNEAFVVKMSSVEAQLVSAQNRIKLLEVEIGEENKRSLMLQRHIADLEAKLELEKKQVETLQLNIKIYTGELSDHDLEIKKLNGEIQDATANFVLEKSQLESSIHKLSETTNELQKQCELFEALKANLQNDIEHVKIQLHEKNVIVDILNANLDKLKFNYDMLMAEKDGVNAKLQTLSADLSVANDQNVCLECTLIELRYEKEQLSAGLDSAKKVITELKSRVEELEKEVGMQAVMISDTAEEKREAIRQLCFSLDYFRSAYEELHDVYAIRKRPTAAMVL